MRIWLSEYNNLYFFCVYVEPSKEMQNFGHVQGGSTLSIKGPKVDKKSILDLDMYFSVGPTYLFNFFGQFWIKSYS